MDIAELRVTSGGKIQSYVERALSALPVRLRPHDGVNTTATDARLLPVVRPLRFG